MPRRKTLIYAFGPYEGFRDNISEAVVGRLRLGPGQTSTVFETVFDRAMLRAALESQQPDTVIGLGQHRTGCKLRLERKAVNLMGPRGGPLELIDPAGPTARFVNLRLPSTPETTVSYDAGTFVCNYSLYWMLDYAQCTESRCAFVHIPRGYDLAAAAAYLQQAIEAVAHAP